MVATALDRCLRKDPAKRFPTGDALADALGPEQQADRELAVPLRVFIKQTREWETTLSYSALGLMLAIPSIILEIVFGLPAWIVPGGIVPALWATVAVLIGLPVFTLVARRGSS